MKILLDSDIISALCKPYEKENYNQAIEKINSFPDNPRICISIITFYEIQYGINADDDNKRVQRIRSFVASAKKNFKTIGIDHKDSEIYGALKHSFQRKTGIGQKTLKKHNIDIIIASQAIANDCLLVSRDKIYSKHLQEFDFELKYSSW